MGSLFYFESKNYLTPNSWCWISEALFHAQFSETPDLTFVESIAVDLKFLTW